MRTTDLIALLALSLPLATLTACEKAEKAADTTEETVEDAADTVGDATEEVVDETQDATEEVVEETEDVVEDATPDKAPSASAEPTTPSLTDQATTALSGAAGAAADDASAATTEALSQLEDVFNDYIATLGDLTTELNSIQTAADFAAKSVGVSQYIDQAKGYYAQIEKANPELVAQVRGVVDSQLAPLTTRFQAEADRLAGLLNSDTLNNLLGSMPLFE